MKHCIHCGHELKNHYKYCTQCQGKQPDIHKSVHPEEAGQQEQQDEQTQSSQQQPYEQQHQPGKQEQYQQTESFNTQDTHGDFKKTKQTHQQVEPGTLRTQKNVKSPNSKRNKILLTTVAFFILLVLGAHLGASAYFDPQRDLKAMDAAIVDDDQDALFNHISFQDQALLNEDDYFQYIKGDTWDSAKTQLRSLFEADNDLSEKVYTSHDTILFTVKPVKHIFGLYTTYDLKAEPASATIQTSDDETNVSFDGVEKTISADEQIELAAYPGTFDLKADATKQFGTFEQTTSIDIEPGEDNQIDITFEGREFTFATDQPEAILFVDGESTEQQLRDLNSIGPLPKGNEIKLYAEMEDDGDLVQSEETVLTDDSDQHLTFMFDDQVSDDMQEADEVDKKQDEIDPEQAGDFVLDFRDDYERAVNNKDFGIISDYLKSGSSAEGELKDYVGDLKETDYDYDFTSNTIKNTETVNDTTAEVVTREQFIFTNHRGETTDYDRQKTYVVEMSDNDYKINAIDYDDTKRD